MSQLGPIKERVARLTITTENEVIEINHDDAEQYQLAIDFSARMSVSRQINRASVNVLGLNRNVRERIAGVTNGVIDISNSFLKFPDSSRDPVPGTDLAPGGVVKTETHRNGHAYVEIDAGYRPGKVARIFEGSSHHARHKQSGTVWGTGIEVGDGLSTRLGGVATRRFDPGSRVFDVVRHIVKMMGLGQGNLTSESYLNAIGKRTLSRLPTGQTVSGDVAPIMDSLLKESGAEWWVDRGQFWITPRGQPIEGEPLQVREGREGGLRRDPEPIEGGGVILDSWLRTDARIGRKVNVESRILSGEYRIETVQHRGSNLRGDFQTVMHCRRIGFIPGIDN